MSDRDAGGAQALFQAQALIERRRYAEARTHLGAALRSRPDDPELLVLSACVDYATDDAAAALRTVEQALRLDPANAGGRELYASLLEDEKRFTEAERLRIDLLREYPREPSYYAAYAHLMLRTLNVEKARRLAEEGLRLEPEHPGCLYALALANLIVGRGRAENAQLATLVREHPEAMRTAIALIIALQDRGDTRGALRIAQELLRSEPDSPEILRLVRELKAVAHWSLLPLYPMIKWGWAGWIGVWVIGVFGLRALSQVAPASVVAVATAVWLGYIVYSWVWPPILRKIV